MTAPVPSIGAESGAAAPNWDKTCFYITAIGDEDSEQRKHSDLFLNHLVTPALKNFGLDVVRADKIAAPGVITSQILQHILYSKLVIVDLSFHNPNVFYEMAIRHATKLPVVQICRKRDKIPFDVNQVRTIMIDDSDVYNFVPNMPTYQSELATQVRGALEGIVVTNPISIFFPALDIRMPPPTR
ncbi:MAG: hypothetical protein JNL19_08750 [Burkholderiales bacterium]|nr:hypothetical protein [Burkholderiales bacterium]